MFTLDANIFVRTVHPSQPEYASCQGLLDELDARELPVIVPLIILPEVAGAVRRETGDVMRARLFSAALATNPHIQFIPIDGTLAREAQEIAADEAVRGMDALYVAVARRYSCTLVTLDDEPRKRAARIVPTMTPADALAALTVTPR